MILGQLRIGARSTTYAALNIGVSFYVNFNHNSIFFVSLFGFGARLKKETLREEGMDYRRKADQANMGKPIWEECFLFTTLLPN